MPCLFPALGTALLLSSLLAVPLHAQSASSLPAAPTPQISSQTSTSTGSSLTSTAVTGGSTGGGFPVTLASGNSFSNAYLGSVQAQPAVPETLPLTLDDAFHLGIRNNLGLIYARQSEGFDRAQREQVLNVLLPNLSIKGSTGINQFNLEAEGFRPGILPEFAALLPAGGGNFPLVVKVDVTQGEADFSQYLFDWSGYDLVKALRHQLHSAEQSSSSARGLVVQNVGIAYLRVVAAESQVAYDQALLQTDTSVLFQSQQRHQAGVGTRLDELRARVQDQTEEQALIGDQGALAKTKIALNRAIGLAPEQAIEVSATEPFPGLDVLPPEAAVEQALAARQDYQSDLEQIQAAELEVKAATRERFPTLIFNGDYGVIGLSGSAFRGVFTAVGTLNIPVFHEAQFRADHQQAEFNLQQARAQAGNLREQIAQQVRSDLIDLHAAGTSVAVARSNVQLSQTALQQSIERFQAGVDVNLPVVEALSTLAESQEQSVNSAFQYNEARLNLARDLGMIDLGYHPEWQGGQPAVLRTRASVEH